MKSKLPMLIALGCLSLGRLGGAETISESIDAQNYALHEVLAAQRTYPGVLANVQKVLVIGYEVKGGIVTGIPAALVNGIFGTKIGQKKLPAWEYVIRIDTLAGEEARIVTVVQGGEPIEAGAHVFVVTGELLETRRCFSVRVIAARTPASYASEGLEEARRAGRAPTPVSPQK